MKSYNTANAKQESLAGLIFAPNYTVIPDELRQLQQWVGWQYVHDPNRPKPKKILVNPDSGGWAKSDDPKTWGPLAKALARYHRDDLDGIGFVFTADDPYCGIDLDNVVDPSTGEISKQAQKIIDSLDSYTEFSPSGTGAHIIVRATLSAKGRKRDGIEIYDRGRFFTMTGQSLARPNPEIYDRQESVDALYARIGASMIKKGYVRREICNSVGPELPDRSVIDLIAATPMGPRFSTLYSGSWKTSYESQSEADLALVALLARFIGRNPSQLDRLFRASGLYRLKWDEHRGDLTYGQHTINKAMGEQ
jgi:putative DNA primase/helicase